MKDNGYVAVLVREAFRRGGIDVEFQFHQWTRAVGLAKMGQVDGYFPEYFDKKILSSAYFSEPFPGGPLGFFKLKSSKIDFDSLENSRGFIIGTVRGYINSKEFDDATFLIKDEVKDDLTNFKKLATGRIDLLVADKYVGMWIVSHYLPEMKDKIEFMDNVLATKQLYVCISRKSRKGDKFLKAFNTGLRLMKEEGMIGQILGENGF